MSLITQTTVVPSQVPLALRSTASASTIKQAAGFGADTVQTAQASAIEKAAAQLLAAMKNAGPVPAATGASRSGQPDGFSLRQPDMARVGIAAGPDSGRLTPEAMLTKVLGSLQQALEKGGLDGLRQRLQSYQAQAQANVSRNERLAEALEKALADAERAGSAADAAAAEAGAAQGALEAARQDVAALQAELDAMDPDDPAFAAKQGELQSAQQRLAAAQGRLDQAAEKLLVASSSFEAALDQVQKQRDQMGAEHQRGTGTPPPDARELTASATLQKLLAMLSALASDVALDKLKSETQALMAALQAREAQNKEAVRKHEEETQRARDAEKKTGCIGKVFKWVSAAVSVVVLAVGVVTANPALIAAGIISVAMTIDSIVGDHTGFSVMGKLTEAIGGAISKALVAVGVDDALAKQIGSIAAAIVVVVAVIAASIMAGNVAGAMQAASTGVASTSRIAQLVEQAVQVVQVLGQMAGLAGALTHGVGQVIVAGIMIDIARLMKSIEESLFGSEVLRELIGKIRDAVAQLDNLAFELLTQASNVMRESDTTGRTIINAMRA